MSYAERGPRGKYGGAVAKDVATRKWADRLYVDPRDNVIVGARNIMKYLGINNYQTFHRWVDEYGFPAIKRPDALWMTTMTSIDQWIFLAAELVLDRKAAAACKVAHTLGKAELMPGTNGYKEPGNAHGESVEPEQPLGEEAAGW